MKLIIFAGEWAQDYGLYRRENSPKQFDKIFSGKSTLELAVNRIQGSFGINNVYIQTQLQYNDIVKEQIPELPLQNIILEPERRNLGPAVCFGMLELKKTGYGGPVAILWADHLMENTQEFIIALMAGKKLIEAQADRFIFLAEKSRFANNNLGWIKIGGEAGSIGERPYYRFCGWKYRPAAPECTIMHESDDYYWNPGYFITSVDFLLEQYRKLAPQIYQSIVTGNYQQAEKIHFDEAIIEKVDLTKAVVIITDMGWSDPGTLYALKEALEKTTSDNVILGQVAQIDTSDSLIYNLEEGKLVAAVGLRGMVVVNTKDALIVVPKDEVVKISSLIEKLKAEGLESYL